MVPSALHDDIEHTQRQQHCKFNRQTNRNGSPWITK